MLLKWLDSPKRDQLLNMDKEKFERQNTVDEEDENEQCSGESQGSYHSGPSENFDYANPLDERKEDDQSCGEAHGTFSKSIEDFLEKEGILRRTKTTIRSEWFLLMVHFWFLCVFAAVLGLGSFGVVLICSGGWCALLLVLVLLVVLWSLHSLSGLLAVCVVSLLGILFLVVSGFPGCFFGELGWWVLCLWFFCFFCFLCLLLLCVVALVSLCSSS